MLSIILISFIAGVLTIVTPCSITILPVILGSSVDSAKNNKRSLVIVGSFILSVFFFSLILKATTLLIDIPLSFWSYISGLLIMGLALSMLIPEFWDKLILKLGFKRKSEEILSTNQKLGSAVFAGAALGPVFTGCSPTYAIILSVLLPANFITGTIYLFTYCLGLGAIFFLISLGGYEFLKKIKWAANPNGYFRKILGVILLIIGILIFFRIDKQIEASLINTDVANFVIQLERGFLEDSL